MTDEDEWTVLKRSWSPIYDIEHRACPNSSLMGMDRIYNLTDLLNYECPNCGEKMPFIRAAKEISERLNED